MLFSVGTLSNPTYRYPCIAVGRSCVCVSVYRTTLVLGGLRNVYRGVCVFLVCYDTVNN